ncbi:RimK/LysX family protein [bacterium]|nr:RimK/LysX family protein [bacterium]
MKRHIIGWREWVSLPDLVIPQIKAKIDTGAKSSSIHAFDLELITRGKLRIARFIIHPLQKNEKKSVAVELPIHDFRSVKSSNGQEELRPVILTRVSLMGLTWPIELTLTRRDDMGFRMLLGRQAIRDKFLINAGKSFFGKKFDKYHINPDKKEKDL